MSKIRVNEIETLDGKGEGLISYPYEANFLIENHNTIIRDGDTEYKLSESTLLPYTTTGAGLPEDGAFVTVGDAALRQDLVQPVATFNNVADMAAATGLGIGRKARTLGYYTPGDGGGNEYEIVAAATGTDDGGSFINLSGSGHQAKGLFSNGVNVKQFGAAGDGATDDRLTIVNAIEFAYGGRLRVPEGSYNFSATIDITSPIHIFGDGQGSTIMTLTDTGPASGLSFTGMTDGSLSGMTVVGNAPTEGGHTVRGASLTRFTFKDLHLKNGGTYCLGLQDGAFVDLTVRDVLCTGSGSDGVDLKNKVDANENVVFENVTIRDFGNADTTATNGLDVRGRVVINNLIVTDFGGRASSNSSGLVLREGELTDTNGLGAHDSVVSNVYIEPDTATGTRGVVIEARKCNLSNIRSLACGVHIDIYQTENSLSGVTLDGGATGVKTNSSAFPSDGNRTNLSSVTARSLSASAFDFDTVENNVTSFILRAIDTGIDLSVNADTCSFGMGSITNATTLPINDGAAGTRIIAVNGVADK